jgi:dihydrofolate synthase/folylpolyglutamate synthase
VLGVLADKDWRGMMKELSRVASRIVLVSPPSAPVNRAWNPRDAAVFASGSGVEAVVQQDFDRAIREAASFEGTVIVTGSFHTVGDALLTLGEKTV